MNNTASQSTRGFNIIFIHSTLDDAGLDPKEFRIFAHLSRRASSGVAWPSVKTMGEVCCISQSRVRLALKTLTERGFVTCEERAGRTYLWTINPPEKWIAVVLTPVKSDSPTPITSDSPPLSLLIAEGNPVRQSIEGNPLPACLDTPEFRDAWATWEQHRKEKRQPLTPSSRKVQLKNLAALGLSRAIAALENSTANGYQGIFEPKGTNHAHLGSNPRNDLTY